MPNAAPEHRKLAAIMFTDMVGYSALAQKNEALALKLLDEHQALLRPFFPKFNGREIETIGDAFLVEFTSALDAVRCAVAIQKALAERNASSPGAARIQIRIGVHIGDVVQREKNVLGDSVNIAARIEPLARPGGICVSQQVFDHVYNKLEVPLVKLGAPELKNIQVPVCLYRVVLPWETEDLSLRERARFQWRLKQRRWAGAAGVALVLAAIALSVWRPPSHSRIESLAVLPLTNLSNDPAQEYFADGITDLLTTELGKIGSLRVTSFQAVKQFKQAGMPLTKMVKALKVDGWVEGMVLRDGPRVAITARLIRAATAEQVWQTNSTRNLSNLVDLQGEVALALAEAMRVKLLPGERTLLSATRPVHPDAMDYYLRGKFSFGEKTELAIAMLEQAIKIDPGFARAHAQLAFAYASKGYFTDPMAIEKARQALANAMALDASLPEVYLVRARLLWTQASGWDASGAIRELAKALSFNSNFDEAYVFRAILYWHLGLLDKSQQDIEKLLALKPTDTQMRSEFGGLFLFQGHYEKALYYYTNFAAQYPVPIAENALASAYQHLHRTNEAWAVVNRFLNSGRADTGGLMTSMQAVLLADAGEKAQASEKIAQAQEKGRNFSHFHHTAYNIAVAYALLNEPAQAVPWLRQTAADGFPNFSWFQRDPNLKSLRSHPEFIRFMAELEKQWKRFNETL